MPSLTTGSNRSLRSLGRAKARPLTKRYALGAKLVRYEPTLKGNPQQLTVEQHFHTAHAISKFYNEAEKVQVKTIATQEVVERHKRAKIFCTKRAWD